MASVMACRRIKKMFIEVLSESTIGYDDFARILDDLGATLTTPQIQAMVVSSDSAAGNAKDMVDISKFMDWLHSGPTAPELFTSEIATNVFKYLDADGSNTIDADELMRLFVREDNPLLDAEGVSALIRTIDLNGDGVVQHGELVSLLQSPVQVLDSDFRRHLVLHFDVNQTVLMLDSITGAGAIAILNEAVSNASWGDVDSEGHWKLISEAPSAVAPRHGLTTYSEFVAQLPHEQGKTLMRTFTEPDQPGHSLAKYVSDLAAALRLPQGLQAPGDTIERLGLHNGVLLLPSFLIALRLLKREGRSFSVCFRTFGADLEKIANEYNALCDNSHPAIRHYLSTLGSGFEDLNKVFLDGSDGAPDMRIDLSPGQHSFGTWIRGDDSLSFVWGSLEQPPYSRASAADLHAFYEEKNLNVEVVSDQSTIRRQMSDLLHVPGKGRTLGLRDYYPAWKASGRNASGGKPLLLETDDQNIQQIFFDDHIRPNDAHIVDVRYADNPSKPSLPIGATWGVTAVRAEPICTILDPLWFVKKIEEAEAGWHLALCRKEALRKAVAHPQFAPGNTICTYTPHNATDTVLLGDCFIVESDDEA
eukprot:TRINITY_DN25071_c0_g1_i1.p1 TRINITY_DN25071_c0_g1~~TRINITY_DN25071_c0_g1_i1.p1  ORF type:complete len:590 (+),score=73.86 TRINITY_DN25071_c0_g1_i1:37-1806(+)